MKKRSKTSKSPHARPKVIIELDKEDLTINQSISEENENSSVSAVPKIVLNKKPSSPTETPMSTKYKTRQKLNIVIKGNYLTINIGKCR